ncbi:tyrosine-type recombinase/integrase [Jiulongibacter sediminis]|uniref:tyrosine-type recombinase/integrase n=1 Tax=Jiulongibacter sediminis TaxID=1605367 RepID=UPI0026ECDC10|nr:tyrosine-type recombinase/integrase [Jiulongibacter sediminis]
MVDLFLSYLKNEKRLSALTCRAYEIDLSQFSDFIAENFESKAQDSTYREIRAWVVSLSDQKLSHTSINRKIASLRAFYSFLLHKREIGQNPMLRVKALKTPQKPPVFIEENATQNLLDQVQFAEDYNGVRDKLILELFYGTGIRLSELIQLKVADVDLFGSKITVLGKRNKQRIIPILSPLRLQLTSYLSLRTQTFEEVADILFLTDKGKPVYPVFVQRLVKKYLSMVLTKTRKSPHVLRHTFATHLLNKGADLNAIKELLGHASLSATQIYTHNSIEQLKAVHAQAHPKAG